MEYSQLAFVIAILNVADDPSDDGDVTDDGNSFTVNWGSWIGYLFVIHSVRINVLCQIMLVHWPIGNKWR